MLAAERLGKESAFVSKLQRRWWSSEQEVGKPLKTFCPICPPACFPAGMALPALASAACGTERTEVAGVCSAWCNARVLSKGLSGCLEELGGAGVVEKHLDVHLTVSTATPGVRVGFPAQGCLARRDASAPLCSPLVPVVASLGRAGEMHPSNQKRQISAPKHFGVI